MKPISPGSFAVAFALLLCDGAGVVVGGDAVKPGAKSIVTSMSRTACTQAVNKGDPNEIPYLVCPGVAGYQLKVSKVDSGRLSITVVSPAQRQYPLDYQDVVTRAMTSLDDKAEWRVVGRVPTPVALIVRVMAHENSGDPAEITGVYWALAKIAADGACVTDRIRQGSMREAQLQKLADTAAIRPCAAPLPDAAN